MPISMTWKPDSGDKVVISPAAEGFTRLGPGLPDVFIDSDGQRGTLVVANGCAKGKATMIGMPLSGTLRIFGASDELAKPRAITLAFGCAHVSRFGAPASYSPPLKWKARYLGSLPSDAASMGNITARLEAADFRYDDTPNANPEQSSTSEGRVCQALWAGSLAAALGIRRDDARQAAQEFVDFQLLRRHYFLYDETGKQLVAAHEPWWRQGAHGWDGQVKATFTSPESPYAFEAVLQHLAFDRLFELAVGFQDYAARLCLGAYLEAVHTRPEFREGTLAAQQRTHGYCLQLDAADKLSGWQTPERAEGGARMLDGWRRACGFAPITGEPYAGFSPAKTAKWSHGYPSLVDWTPYAKANNLALPLGLAPPLPGETCDHLIGFLEATAVARGKPANAYTFGPSGLWQPQTIVFMLGPVMEGLCDLRDAGVEGDIHKLIQHAAACVTGPGHSPGGIGPTGTVIPANPVHDAYFCRKPSRVMPGPGKNSTTRWLVNGLLRAAPSCGENLQADCIELAGWIWHATDYPKADALINLETMGVLPIATFGAKT